MIPEDARDRYKFSDHHDPMRIQGALFYALEKSRTEGGNLYVEAEKLLGETLALLNEQIPQANMRVSREETARELVTAIKTNVVVSKKGNIYLPHVFNQESETARKVVEMLLETPEPVLLGPVMERINGRSFSNEQRENDSGGFHRQGRAASESGREESLVPQNAAQRRDGAQPAAGHGSVGDFRGAAVRRHQ